MVLPHEVRLFLTTFRSVRMGEFAFACAMGLPMSFELSFPPERRVGWFQFSVFPLFVA
jgi:hypothetical protein